MNYWKVLSLFLVLSTGMAYGMEERGREKFVELVKQYYPSSEQFPQKTWEEIITKWYDPLVEVAREENEPIETVVQFNIIEGNKLKSDLLREVSRLYEEQAFTEFTTRQIALEESLIKNLGELRRILPKLNKLLSEEAYETSEERKSKLARIMAGVQAELRSSNTPFAKAKAARFERQARAEAARRRSVEAIEAKIAEDMRKKQKNLEKIESLKEEIDEYENQLTKVRAGSKEQAALLKKVLERNNALDNTARELEKDNENFRKDSEELLKEQRNKVDELQIDLIDTKQEIARLKKDLEEATQRLGKAAPEVKELEKEARVVNDLLKFEEFNEITAENQVKKTEEKIEKEAEAPEKLGERKEYVIKEFESQVNDIFVEGLKKVYSGILEAYRPFEKNLQIMKQLVVNVSFEPQKYAEESKELVRIKKDLKKAYDTNKLYHVLEDIKDQFQGLNFKDKQILSNLLQEIKNMFDSICDLDVVVPQNLEIADKNNVENMIKAVKRACKDYGLKVEPKGFIGYSLGQMLYTIINQFK